MFICVSSDIKYSYAVPTGWSLKIMEPQVLPSICFMCVPVSCGTTRVGELRWTRNVDLTCKMRIWKFFLVAQCPTSTCERLFRDPAAPGGNTPALCCARSTEQPVDCCCITIHIRTTIFKLVAVTSQKLPIRFAALRCGYMCEFSQTKDDGRDNKD